ncbi:hypothetical protein OIU85_002439, partial [Salix viminalis]
RKDSGRTWWKTLINGGTTDLTRKTQNLPISSTKETGEGLWLDTSPAWVLPKLPPTKGAENVAGTEGYNSPWGQGST